ncbi:MAG: hypothetical protein JSU64_00305 [candidate division WOR-3 bacterium]|nr:MAG: hypothetical protein JSU64_00305 [candidate division WOR-3 bacterium]
MISLLILLVSFTQKGIADSPVILDGIGSRYASEYVLITTPAGIYTFDRNAETWKVITTAHGLPDNDVHLMGIDQGILWVATEQGLASADIRLNDWITYEMPGTVNGITFDDNYAWVAGDFGLKRFDKYVEQWEDIDTVPAQDIFFDKKYLWIATTQGIRRYNLQFERFEEITAAPKMNFYHIIETRSKIWFLAHDMFVVHDRNAESWAEHNAFDVDDYAVLGDSVYIVSNNTVILFDPKTNSWDPFVDVEGLREVNGVATNPQFSNNISFATNQGLFLYDPLEKVRVVYNRANGMFDDSVSDSYESSKYIFAIGRERLQLYDKGTSIWHVEEFTATRGMRTKILRYDEAGLHLDAVEGMDLRLQGRAYYSISGDFADSIDWDDYSTINLRLIAQHESNRALSVYYDDTDKEDTLYGFGYRGLDTDFIHRINGGFIESEYYEFDLVPEFSTFGANLKLRHREHGLTAQGGQLKSSYQSDFFYGRSFEKRGALLDTDFSRNSFFSIPESHLVTREGTDTIFVDDRLAATNDIDTRTGYIVAGINGDFDPMINGLDYFIDYQAGMLQLLRPAGEDHIVVLRADGQDIIIQSDSVRDNAVVNIYVLGPDMIPGSLELRITDTLGAGHPLSEFGIDNDNDNKVDPQFINHRLGYLSFPQPRPFPDEVYTQQLHIYLMDYTFTTRTVFYTLSKQPVLTGSERIVVDGEEMIRNYHYYIDYTNGNVLFISEETVSDFSEVEIQYVAIERTRTDPFYSVQPNIKVTDNINVAPGYSSIVDENIFHLSGKYQGGAERKSLTFVPQIGVTEDKDYAQEYRLVANYHMFTLHANYRNFSQGFESFGLTERRHGILRRSGGISLGVEPFDQLRLTANLKKETLVDSVSNLNKTEYISGKVEYLNTTLPNGFLLIARSTLPDYENTRLQGKANYSLAVAGNRVVLTSSARNDFFHFAEGNEKRIFEYIASANLALRFPVGIDLYTYNNNLYSGDYREKIENETRVALNIDAVPGLYYTGNYQQKRETFFLPDAKDVSIVSYTYNNLNIAPGRWYAPLNVVNFAFGTGQNFDEYLGTLPPDRGLPSFIFRPIEEDVTALSDLRNMYARVFLIPFANLNVQLQRSVNKSGSARYDTPILRPTYIDEIRAEYEQAQIGFLIAVFNRTESRYYPTKTATNAYLEWTKPWSGKFRTKLSTNLRADTDEYPTLQTRNTESTVKLEALWRFGRRSYINVGVGGRRQDRYTTGVSNSLLPGCTVYLNIIEFLYMQFDYEATILLGDSTTHFASARITGSF